LPRLNHGMTVPIISANPAPVSPRRVPAPVRTSRLIGAESLPRSPSPRHGPATAGPGGPAAPAYRSMSPAPSPGDRVETTNRSACPAEVTHDLSARTRTPSPSEPSATARDTGAQKCDREPRSLNASVASRRPVSSASRPGVPLGGAAAHVIAALACIRDTIAVDPHASASAYTTPPDPTGPAPSPPTSAGSVSPSRPDTRSASTAASGNTPSASTSAAAAEATLSTGSSTLSRSARTVDPFGRPVPMGSIRDRRQTEDQQADREPQEQRQGRPVAAQPVRTPTERDELHHRSHREPGPGGRHQLAAPQPATRDGQDAQHQQHHQAGPVQPHHPVLVPVHQGEQPAREHADPEDQRRPVHPFDHRRHPSQPLRGPQQQHGQPPVGLQPNRSE